MCRDANSSRRVSKVDTKTCNLLMLPKYNILFNSKLLNDELIAQTEYFLKEISIEKYITKKLMISEYNGGKFIEDLFPKQTKITEWFQNNRIKIMSEVRK